MQNDSWDGVMRNSWDEKIQTARHKIRSFNKISLSEILCFRTAEIHKTIPVGVSWYNNDFQLIYLIVCRF